MKQTFIIANWKAQLPSGGVKSWVLKINALTTTQEKTVIVCPDYTHLSEVVNNMFTVGAQDISPFAEGPYTGTVSGGILKEFASYVLVGHSERRTHFKESDEVCVQKFEMAQKYGLTTIFCVQDEKTPVPSGVSIVAYEPPTAIGSGNPDTPENAQLVADAIKQKTGVGYVLYGGSVEPQNVSSFTTMPDISGVLVGGASLDPDRFSSIIKNA